MFFYNPRIYRLFLYSSWCIAALALFLAIAVPAYPAISTTTAGMRTLQIIGGILGVLGSFAALIIFFGMVIYLFAGDRSSTKLGKTMWLVVFLFTGFFGSALYFFTTYRKQVYPALKSV